MLDTMFGTCIVSSESLRSPRKPLIWQAPTSCRCLQPISSGDGNGWREEEKAFSCAHGSDRGTGPHKGQSCIGEWPSFVSGCQAFSSFSLCTMYSGESGAGLLVSAHEGGNTGAHAPRRRRSCLRCPLRLPTLQPYHATRELCAPAPPLSLRPLRL
jgi:hypothetical protein